jgi:ribosomal protein S5
VVSVFLSCSPYSPYRPLRRTVDLDVLVRSRTGTVVFVVPAAHGTGLVLTVLLLVLTLAGNQST